VADPKAACAFFSDVLGMCVEARHRRRRLLLLRAPPPHHRILGHRRSTITTFRFPEASFDLYFMATLTLDEVATPDDALPPVWCWPRATLELTHNYGTEAAPAGTKVYCTGNESPHEGFACVGFTVSDGAGFMAAATRAGVRIIAPWTAHGGGFGVIAEPSTGYAVRIVERPRRGGPAAGTTAAASAPASADAASSAPRDFAPRLLDSVLRVTDATATAAFYRDHFHANVVARRAVGGVLRGDAVVAYVATSSHGGRVPAAPAAAAEAATADWRYPSLLTGYDSAIGLVVDPDLAAAGRAPCSGNVDPGRGFGHVGFLVDDLDAFCATLESSGVRFKKRPSEGRMRGIAFALDPDGYWVEIIQRGWRGS